MILHSIRKQVYYVSDHELLIGAWSFNAQGGTLVI